MDMTPEDQHRQLAREAEEELTRLNSLVEHPPDSTTADRLAGLRLALRELETWCELLVDAQRIANRRSAALGAMEELESMPGTAADHLITKLSQAGSLKHWEDLKESGRTAGKLEPALEAKKRILARIAELEKEYSKVVKA